MTTSLNLSDVQDSLPIDGRLITLSKNENVDGVAFVSGIQGVICTTFTVEEIQIPTGKSRLRHLCGSAAFATPWDISITGGRTLNWKIS